MSQPNSPLPTSSTPSLPSKLTESLNAARRGESPTPSTSNRKNQVVLTPTARKQALRDFYNLDKNRAITSTDLDKEGFNGKDYVDKLVREKNLASLIRMENDLVQGMSFVTLVNQIFGIWMGRENLWFMIIIINLLLLRRRYGRYFVSRLK
jgi:hypothetical protein